MSVDDQSWFILLLRRDLLLSTHTRLLTSVLDVDAGVHEGFGEDHRAQRLLAGTTLHFKDVIDCHGGLAMDRKTAI